MSAKLALLPDKPPKEYWDFTYNQLAVVYGTLIELVPLKHHV